MIILTDSKTFRKKFINGEKDSTILGATYFIVSQKIMKHNEDDFPNIYIANSKLYPEMDVLMYSDYDDIKREYREQLLRSMAFLAAVVKSDILDRGLNIFLCTKEEMKMGYFKMLSSFIVDYFKYPTYSIDDYKKYKKHVNDECGLKYTKKLLKYCQHFIDEDDIKAIMNTIPNVNFEIEGREEQVYKYLEGFNKTVIREVSKILSIQGVKNKKKKDLILEIIEEVHYC